MKFTLSWLKDHLDTTASLDELSAKLSAIGLEVEGIEDPARALQAFTLARVVEAKQHPNADRLRVAEVEIAKGKTVEVVCGAPNCRPGMITVFAALGTYIPGSKITLEKKPVRGVVSNGMLCSAAELELADDSEGILDIPEDVGAKHIGERYVDVMGLGDPVIEIKLTPNRPDCTGVRGVARDLAAAGLGTLKPEPKLGKTEGDFDCPVAIELEFSKETASACPVFAGRYVKGVKNGPSPDWLQKRLKAVGQRPINALVDVTNYISLDRGRPLHVYDADKLAGAVRARLGKQGEKFLGLDGKEHAVDETMCVIADASGPLGLGGILGGDTTGCTEATSNVLIESAWFDPLRTAATGRKAGLVTDARYRFERGVDPASVRPGLDQATDMILKLAGGKPSKARIAGKEPVEARTIAFDYARIAKLTGVTLTDAEITAKLTGLGCTVEAPKGKPAKVSVPTWRPDIHGPADLVEEVLRLAGLDRLPATPLPRLQGVAEPVLTERQRRARRTRRLLAGRGLVEAVTWSFIPRAQAQLFGGGSDALELANPISVEMSSMRPSLLAGLVTAVQRNRNRGFDDVALFELGQTYRGEKPEDQGLAAAGVRAGTARVTGAGRHWQGKAAEAGVFDVKADAVAILAELGIEATKPQITRDAPAWYHPGRSATLRLGPKTVLAYFGELHPDTLASLKVDGPVSAFEVFLDALPPEKKKSRAKPRLATADLLPVRRDFAFVLDRKTPAGDVVRAALAADKALIANVSVFDLYEGGEMEKAGKKSLAIEVTLQPKAETLTDAAIDAVAQRIIAEVKRATGGEVRA
jgi:phenylalanyl-tRNA synthetase beta chain